MNTPYSFYQFCGFFAAVSGAATVAHQNRGHGTDVAGIGAGPGRVGNYTLFLCTLETKFFDKFVEKLGFSNSEML